MSQPLVVDVPHSLGTAEARRRVEANLGGLSGKLPAGAQVRPSWEGDRLRLDITMLGQQVEAHLDIMDSIVRITVLLPAALAFFRQMLEAGLRRSGQVLLEDRTKEPG
jgi:Putative polyhydroxyalkanoic acid system protein (PHA_gran_rgn)